MSDVSEQEYDEDQEGVDEPEISQGEGDEGENDGAEQEEEEVCYVLYTFVWGKAAEFGTVFSIFVEMMYSV